MERIAKGAASLRFRYAIPLPESETSFNSVALSCCALRYWMSAFGLISRTDMSLSFLIPVFLVDDCCAITVSECHPRSLIQPLPAPSRSLYQGSVQCMHTSPCPLQRVGVTMDYSLIIPVQCPPSIHVQDCTMIHLLLVADQLRSRGIISRGRSLELLIPDFLSLEAGFCLFGRV